MAAAEPVIRAALPDANVPDVGPQHRRPGPHGPLPSWTRSSRSGSPSTTRARPASSATRRTPATPRVRSLSPELAKGLEFDLVVLVDPESFGAASRARSTGTSR